MGGDAADMHLELADTLARRNHLAAVSARLGDQHVFRTPALALDQVARGETARLLVGNDEMGDRQRRSSLAEKTVERLISDIDATLHVADARAEGDVALDLEGKPLDEAGRMHGIEMAQDENAGLAFAQGERAMT